MKNLSREQLIKKYITAQKLGLADAFIHLIHQEMKARKITDQDIFDAHIKNKQYYPN